MLRFGVCSIGAGIAVVAIVLAAKSVGTHPPDWARDGSRAERLGISVAPQWHPNNPAYRTLGFSPLPEDARVRLASLETEMASAESTRAKDSVPFEERYSLTERFDEPFGVARWIKRVAVNAARTERVLPQRVTATETVLRASAPVETTGSAPPIGGLRPAAAAHAPSSAATANSANGGVRPPKAWLASLSSPSSSSSSSPDSQSRTAIYDISAQVVYLPNGRRLEAHSGLGSYMDDPRYVHIRRIGATPPNTYRLVLRENLFHGVQAIRLVPASGSNMFGRDGILAHHYLLGPNGQSNGCVSFADYPAFLAAYLNGEIDRLVVVERLDSPPHGSAFAAGWWLEKAFKGLAKPFERGLGT